MLRVFRFGACHAHIPEHRAADSRADPQPEIAQTYRDRGHTVIRNALNRTTLEEVQRSVAKRLISSGVSDGTYTEQGQLRHLERENEDPADLVLDETSRLKVVEPCFQDPNLVKHIGELLDCDELFSHPLKWIRSLPPQESETSFPAGVHQDYMELQGSSRQLTMWAPVFPVSKVSGSFPLFNTDGTKSLLPMRLAENPSGWEVTSEALGERFVYDLDVGDVLIFNTFTPHGGATNSSDGIRVSIEARYQPLEDPMSASYLARPVIRSDWDEHYVGWSDRWAHHWRDRHPATIPFDDT